MAESKHRVSRSSLADASADASATEYPVVPDITELTFPAVTGYSQAMVGFNGGSTTTYDLNKVVTISAQSVPEEGNTPYLQVFSQLVGAEETSTSYLFYQNSRDGNSRNFYRSPNSSGSDAVFIGNVPNTNPNPEDTTLKSVFTQPVDTDPVIIIGDMIIDPPIGGDKK